MKTNILFDFQNLVFRLFFAIPETNLVKLRQDLSKAVLVALFNIYKRFPESKLVIFMDGISSWRKSTYELYKANRVGSIFKTKGREVEEQQLVFDLIDKFKEFFEKTNVPVYTYTHAESDDLIAIFTDLHSSEKNIIVSNDSDFYQLITDNTFIYNPSNEMLITLKGVYNEQKEPQVFSLDNNGKIKLGKEDGILINEVDNWTEFSLFTKIVRGDSSDNIMSSYPGVRMKSTPKKIGIMEAYKGRKEKNFEYTNFMEQEWVNHLGDKILVKEAFEKNNVLINLRSQPENIRKEFTDYITSNNKEKTLAYSVNQNFISFIRDEEIDLEPEQKNDFIYMFI